MKHKLNCPCSLSSPPPFQSVYTVCCPIKQSFSKKYRKNNSSSLTVIKFGDENCFFVGTSQTCVQILERYDRQSLPHNEPGRFHVKPLDAGFDPIVHPPLSARLQVTWWHRGMRSDQRYARLLSLKTQNVGTNVPDFMKC